MTTKKKIHTPYELFGVECGKGWYELIDPILNYIIEYNKKQKREEDKIEVTQIKEKFGRLRIYTNFVTKELDKMIDDAEDESAQICELCGKREDIGQTMGWITTICRSCVLKSTKDNQYPKQWYSYNDKKAYWVIDGEIKEDIKKDDLS